MTTDLFPASTNITFLTRGDPGNYDFVNITIPKSAITYGTTQKVYFDNQPAEDQGYTQDADNYYVWCTTRFSQNFFGTRTIVFADAQTTQTITVILGIIAAAIIAIVVAVTIFLLWGRKRKT